MSDNVVAAPVKGIINAFHKGSVICRRIIKAASGNASASQMLETVEPAQHLERSLAYCEGQVKDAYFNSVDILGEGYPVAILNDPVVTNKLQSLAIKLMDQVLGLDEYNDDPDSFDLSSIYRIQSDAEIYCGQTIETLGILQQQMLSAGLGLFRLPDRDDRSQLSSMRQSTSRPPSQVSPMMDTPTISFSSRLASVDEHKTRVNNTVPTEMNIPTGTSYGSFKGERRVPAPETEWTEQLDENTLSRLISREDVDRQMRANEELLEKRRRSKISFDRDYRSPRQTSMLSTSTTSPRPPSYAFESPILGHHSQFTASPIQTSRPNSELLIPSTLGRDLQPLPLRPQLSQERYSTLERHDSGNSEQMFFGPPESPPLSSGRQSGNEEWDKIARTLKVPGFGDGVPDGLMVVNELISDPGLMLANENENNEPTPATSVQSVDYPMRPDSSFYLYGGFCEGAKMILNNEKNALKVIRKPGVSENFQALLSMKCVKCSYELGYEVYERDIALDRAGIYTIGDIRFRSRLLSKCHLPARHTDDSAYACMFCIEEGKTVNDWDATIFFSVPSFFRHLQRHTRPVKAPEGITVLNGKQDDTVLDFDIHFLTEDSKPDPYIDIASKLAALPTAHAIMNHRERAKGFKDRDPDSRRTLQFAVGARIVGVTYPPQYNGAWCHGYHDSEAGHFPASTIALNTPSKDDITMNPTSSLCATARWDHKHKEHTSQFTWLTFSKREKITNIGFPYQDAWCWTGQNSKGKWGTFPACFVMDLNEGSTRLPATAAGRAGVGHRQPSGDASPSGGASGFLSRLPSHPFQRRNTGD